MSRQPNVDVFKIQGQLDIETKLVASQSANKYLDSSQVIPVRDLGFHHVVGPGQEESVSKLLVEVAAICHEGRGEEDVSGNGGHLTLEGCTARLPSGSLVSQAGQESFTPLHLQPRHTHTKQ